MTEKGNYVSLGKSNLKIANLPKGTAKETPKGKKSQGA